MNYRFPPDVEELVRKGMAEGTYSNEDDLLRDALRALECERHVVEADAEVVDGVRRGLEQMKRGLGRPFEEFTTDFKASRELTRDG